MVTVLQIFIHLINEYYEMGIHFKNSAQQVYLGGGSLLTTEDKKGAFMKT